MGFSVKDAGVKYDTKSTTAFDCYWVGFIMDEDYMEDTKATSQSTPFPVTIPSVVEKN